LYLKGERQRALEGFSGLARTTVITIIEHGLSCIWLGLPSFPSTKDFGRNAGIIPGFENAIGIIDSTNLRVPKPGTESGLWHLSKETRFECAMKAQLICDPYGFVMGASVGWPASVHDVPSTVEFLASEGRNIALRNITPVGERSSSSSTNSRTTTSWGIIPFRGKGSDIHRPSAPIASSVEPKTSTSALLSVSGHDSEVFSSEIAVFLPPPYTLLADSGYRGLDDIVERPFISSETSSSSKSLRRDVRNPGIGFHKPRTLSKKQREERMLYNARLQH
jgi:hypothetical protein